MANKIKNKFTHPKSTEFTPKDLIIDVNIGTTVINNVDIDSGTIDGVKIGLGSPDFIFGTKFTATGDTVGTPRYTSRGTGQGTNLEITNSNKAFSSYNSGGAILLIKNSCFIY